MSKKITYFMFILAFLITMSGCASYYDMQKEHMKTQQELIKAQYGHAEYYHPEEQKNKVENTFKVELDDQQKVKSMSANLEPLLLAMRPPERRVSLADIGPPPDHWAVRVWKDTLYSPVASALVYIWGVTQIADTISDGAGHNTTNTNSGNTGSYNRAGGGQAVTTGAGAATFDASNVNRSNHSLNNANNDQSSNMSTEGSYNDASDRSDNSTMETHDENWNDSHDQNWQDSGNVDNRSNYENPDNRSNYENPDNRYDYDNPVNSTTPLPVP